MPYSIQIYCELVGVIAMQNTNHKIIIATIILSLAFSIAPTAIADPEDDLQLSKKIEADNNAFKRQFAANSRKTAENLMNRMPAAALTFIHTAVHMDPDDEASQADLEDIIRALGKNPHSFNDRVALGDQCTEKGDMHGAVVEYQAALSLRNDPEVKEKLAKAESTFAPTESEAHALAYVNRRNQSYEAWKQGKKFSDLPPLDADAPKQIGGITWHTNMHTAEDLAKKENKLVFAYFYSDDNEGCKRTEAEVFTDPQVERELKEKFICASLNSGFMENDKYVGELKLVAVPGMAIYNGDDGKLAFFQGYRDATFFLHTLNQVMDMIPQLKRGQMVRFHNELKEQ
jgi:hypothetical protein